RLKNALTDNPPKFLRAHKILARLLSVRRPWSSLLAAFSVNEDFVESFTLYTLTKANPTLSSLGLAIPLPGQPIRVNIPATLSSRPLVAAKLLCFDNWFLRHP